MTGSNAGVKALIRELQDEFNHTLSADRYQLLVEYYMARAQLIASLFGLIDDQLETVTIDHVLLGDRSSVSALRDESVRGVTDARPAATATT